MKWRRISNWIYPIIMILAVILGAVIGNYEVELRRSKESQLLELMDSKFKSIELQYNGLRSRVDSLEAEVLLKLNSIDSISRYQIESLDKSLKSLRRDFIILRDIRIFNYPD